MYGLGYDEDEDDLMEMNPEEMELAYAMPGEKNAIAVSSAGDLWGGYARSNGGSSGGQGQGGLGQGGGQGQEEQANLWMDKPPPDFTAGQLLSQPWEAVYVRRGYVLGC